MHRFIVALATLASFIAAGTAEAAPANSNKPQGGQVQDNTIMTHHSMSKKKMHHKAPMKHKSM